MCLRPVEDDDKFMAGVTTEGGFTSMPWYLCHIFVCQSGKKELINLHALYHLTIVVLSAWGLNELGINHLAPLLLIPLRVLLRQPFNRYNTLPIRIRNCLRARPPHHTQQISRINPVCSYSTSHPLFSLFFSTSHAIFYHNKCYFSTSLCYKIIVTYAPAAC